MQGPIGPQGLPGVVDLEADSDQDGVADWLEVAAGSDPNDALSLPLDADQDGDGFLDLAAAAKDDGTITW